MWLYVCVYVCTYAYIHVYFCELNIGMYLCMCVNLCVHIGVDTYLRDYGEFESGRMYFVLEPLIQPCEYKWRWLNKSGVGT